jgi:hypothetical protein
LNGNDNAAAIYWGTGKLRTARTPFRYAPVSIFISPRRARLVVWLLIDFYWRTNSLSAGIRKNGEKAAPFRLGAASLSWTEFELL